MEIEIQTPQTSTPAPDAADPIKQVSLFRNVPSSAASGDASGTDAGGDDAGDDAVDRLAGGEEKPTKARALVTETVTDDDRVRELAAMKRAREAAKADAAEKPAKEPVKAAPAAKETVKPEAPPPAEAEEQEEPDAEMLARIRLREKQQAAREAGRAEGEAEAKRILEAARAEAEQIRASLKAEIEKAKTDAAADLRKRLAVSPGALLRELEVQPDAFLKDIVEENSPEGQMKRLLRQQQQELAELKASLERRTKAEEDARAEAEARARAASREHVERAFLAVAAPETYPNARALYDDTELVAEAYKIAGRRKAENLPCGDADLLAELESRASKRLDALRQKWGGAGADAAPAAKATPRTLSAATASERRSTPKLPSEMTEDELRDHEIATIRRVREEAAKAPKKKR